MFFSTVNPKRKLFNIEVDEVSLVDKAANGRKFFVIKRHKPMEVKPLKKELIDLLKSFVPQNAVVDLEKLEISEEDQEKLLKSLKVLESYKNDVPDEIIKAISTVLFTQIEMKKSDEIEPKKDTKDNTVDVLDEEILTKAIVAAIAEAAKLDKDEIKVGELVTSLTEKLDKILTCVEKKDDSEEDEDKENDKMYTEKEAQNMKDESYNKGVEDTIAEVESTYGKDK